MSAPFARKEITIAQMAPWELWFAKNRYVSEDEMRMMAENRLPPERIKELSETFDAAFKAIRDAQCPGLQWWMTQGRARS
jgi:hypothetical protein